MSPSCIKLKVRLSLPDDN